MTVRGEAAREVEPDRLTVSFLLQTRADSPDAAFAELAGRSGALDRVLDAAGAAVIVRRPSSVAVAQDYDRRSGQPRGYAATRTVTVEVRVDRAPGDLLRQAVDAAGASVQHTRWLVDDDNAAWAGVRAAAAEDARTRADVYARAVGMQLGVLDWVAEPGLGPRRGVLPAGGEFPHAAGEEVRAMTAAGPGGGEGERLVLDLRPEPVTIRAAVETSYTLTPTPPDRSGQYL